MGKQKPTSPLASCKLHVPLHHLFPSWFTSPSSLVVVITGVVHGSCRLFEAATTAWKRAWGRVCMEARVDWGRVHSVHATEVLLIFSPIKPSKKAEILLASSPTELHKEAGILLASLLFFLREL